MTRWAIMTGEYPPKAGGVSDYTELVAKELASAGDEVIVFTPIHPGGPAKGGPGIVVHQLPDHFGPRSLSLIERILKIGAAPDRILIQYVPHAFGFKAMNLPFAIWVATRLKKFAPVWVMFHEVAFPFSWRPLKYALLATMHRAMARLIVGAAERIFVSIPAWEDLLSRIYRPLKGVEWLPVPCNVELSAPAPLIAEARQRYLTSDGFLVGHFGTFGHQSQGVLEVALLELIRLVPKTEVLLIGRGGEEFRTRLVAERPDLKAKIHATGGLSSLSVSAHLRACDLLLLPFPDGVSSRRGRMMAGLANGVPIVTNLGYHSEAIWKSRELAVTGKPDPIDMAQLACSLLERQADRIELSQRGLKLYQEIFAIENTIVKLRCKDN